MKVRYHGFINLPQTDIENILPGARRSSAHTHTHTHRGEDSYRPTFSTNTFDVSMATRRNVLALTIIVYFTSSTAIPLSLRVASYIPRGQFFLPPPSSRRIITTTGSVNGASIYRVQGTMVYIYVGRDAHLGSVHRRRNDDDFTCS